MWQDQHPKIEHLKKGTPLFDKYIVDLIISVGGLVSTLDKALLIVET